MSGQASGSDIVQPSAPSATLDDLDWWLTLAPTLEWTWASTFADRAPHWYVVANRVGGLTWADHIRAGRVIRTFGEPGKFWRLTNLYLFTADRSMKFWCMWASPTARDRDAQTINLAHAADTYGAQSGYDADRLRDLWLPIGADTVLTVEAKRGRRK